MRTRCPHCHQPVEIVADDPLVEILCTTCGSTFSLATGRTETYGAGAVKTIGRFHLLEQLGRGSFGSVWKARDEELERIVALKLPRYEQLDDVEAERFLREARATAQLHHPGIVSIHEVAREDEQIYIVSDFIEGATLGEWVCAKPPGLREVAELVAQVADALGHAHERGIVHRDLKPANILIDADGRPHLTDFGLAKRDAGEITMTVEGQILGTPAYMSPEQARGEGHRVDLRADIYSLGVILFELLTGELPFRGSSRMMILQILNDEPPQLRTLQGAVPRDLDTIVLKCLAKEPARRYQTAGELSADLRRWAAGEPIHARPVGRIEQAWRWCRRNPAVAALATCVMGLLVAVAVVSAAAAARMGRLAERERVARTDAEAHFRSARAAVDAMLTEVGDEDLANAPYMEAVRRLLLERALAFYQDLLDARPENPGLRQELARAYHRVGQINAMLGRPENAREAYERAITMFEQLTAKVPNDPEHRHLLAISYDFLGELLRQGGTDLQAAEQHYRDALRIQDDLVRDNSARRDFRRERTRSHNNLGILLMDTGRNEEAEHSFTSAIEGLEQLVAENPSLGAFQADLARAYINRGVLARKQKRVSHAEQAYAKAVGILGELVAAHPEEREYRYKWAVSYLDLGNLLLEETPRFDDALANCETANQLLRALEAAFPAIPLYCRELANSYISLANVHARAGDLDAARDAFEQALKHLDELAVNFADLAKGDAAYHSLHGITLGGLGYVALTRRAADEARDFVERAAQAQSAAVQLQPDNPEYRRRLELHYSFLAQILKKLGREDEARQAQRKAEGLKPGS